MTTSNNSVDTLSVPYCSLFSFPQQRNYVSLPFSATRGHPVAAGGQAGTPLVVQDDAEQATVDGKPAVVIDEAQLLEIVHEMTDA